MGFEINLLRAYPRTSRDVKARGTSKTDEDREIARQFGKDFFDGDRRHGYGGFNYHPRFWGPVIPDFIEYYGLDNNSSVLDVGCAKGFMLYELKKALPGLTISGIDVSQYALDNAIESVKSDLRVADAKSIPFDDNSFDLVVSINTIHNLDVGDLKLSLKEISRVSKKNSFITVDAYRNDIEREAMFNWNLTARTILSVNEWEVLFREVGYLGDYYWFMP